MLLYANFLLLFGFALSIENVTIISIAIKYFPAYLLVGIAGYFLNDLFDIKADALSNKFNSTNIIPPFVLLILILTFWSCGFYLIYSISKQAGFILIAQFVVLLAYSVPFIRLKEKGFLGLITDAFYAHVIPAIILLSLLQKQTVVPVQFWISFISFGFLLGLRDIALHQIADVEKDTVSNTTTFAVKNLQTINNLIEKFNFSALVLLCVFLLFIFINSNSVLFFALLVCLSISYFFVLYKYKKNTGDFLIFNYILISSFLFLYLLISTKNYIGIILILHPYFLQKIKSLVNWLFITLIPLIFNYSLYFFFLFLGRNLKVKPLLQKKISLKNTQK